MEETLDLRQLLSVLRRRIRLLVTVPVLAALVAAGLSLYVIPPTYEAFTTLWVVKREGGPLDYNSLLLNRNLTKTYAEIAKSRTVAQATIERLGLQEEPEELLERVTVTPVRDTEILRIAVEDGDPEQAARIANALAEEFMAELPKFIELDNVRVVDPARVPQEPVRPRPLLNTLLAFVLGGMAAVGAAFLLEALDITLRTPEDVEQCLGLPLLGTVPEVVPGNEPRPAPAGARRRRPAPARVEGGDQP